MSTLLLVALIVLAVYALVVVGLMVAGRKEHARALAGFIPDCVVLFRRLAADARLPRCHRLLIGATIFYLVSPIDLIPDFIPVAGQLDDAIVVGLVLRAVLRASGRTLIAEHWPGPEASLTVVYRLAAA